MKDAGITLIGHMKSCHCISCLKNISESEKATVKSHKAGLDLNFLKNCQSFHVFPKFLCFQLPNTSNHNVLAIRKALIKNCHHKMDNRTLSHTVSDELSSDISEF